MDTTEILVLVGGVSLVVLVVWYFFWSEGERATAQVSVGGAQRIRVTVKGGYSPDVIVVKRGVPVELDFYRDEASDCTEQVVFGDFGISRRLPAFKTTPVRFTPERAGVFTFNCGMNMVRGKLVVED
ncbi:MAG TPA: cupredoxin domain-containing protein [Pyrinomonadaceae bacterium]|jgi:plastocyanin domain-containing protein|nr:cupredoxin domain-containing protein [Pyrinomonadaceae bacterium]